MNNQNYLADVKAQYEHLPYPPVDPQDEKKRLQRTWLEDLPMMNHYCFQGKQSFRQGFRALVAGGGTGDATIFLAEQLRATDAEIVHLDLSAASIAIARERAALRGLNNIRWIEDSLLNAPDLGLGKFDYINCCGVLHHLADPDAGLRALQAVLADGGAMGVMVYGAIGRFGIYQMQAMLRLANAADASADAKIAQARALLSVLPASNWFKRGEDLYGDSRKGDADLYDMFLHSQDRAYTVEQLYAWLADQHGYHITLSDIHRGRFPYLPAMTLRQDATLMRASLAGMSARAQHALSELILGDLLRHTFYLTGSVAATAAYGDAQMIPFFFHEPLTGAALAPVFTSRDGKPITLHHPFLGLTTQIDAGTYSATILRHVDGRRTFQQVFDLVRAEPAWRHDAPDNTALFADFRASYDALNAIERLLLRHASCPAL
ncbi:class I SAM-dependent methyltransferase [Massilia sp. TWR1-2-2]|uniref:class I SAM-dependent methyltransferase n=1 Tax=Massilia sp. TWR1-2-2 TaxID=2804584 RepID=UPI003CED2EA0